MDILDRFDRFLELPREQAYNQYLDERNLRIFKIMLIIFAGIFGIVTIVNVAENQTFNISLVLSLLTTAILLTARIFYRKLFNISNIRRYIFIFLIFQLFMTIAVEVTFPEDIHEGNGKDNKELIEKRKETESKADINISMDTDKDNSFVQYILFFGIMVLIFRFSRTEIIQLFAMGAGIPLLAMLFFNSSFSAKSGIPNLIIALMFFVIAFVAERKRQRRFYEQYDFNYRKNYENLRMKKELNYAREIQLSMLPEKNAVIGEIEISATSIPASEVGGDYFDYFKISDNETGFFICDVSGHGVASGLLLSGLRSCMHLILEDSTNPKVIIEKLNRMIRKTQNRKMFVTAVFAVIDTHNNRCILYNAGHLPPYKISGSSKEIFKIKKHGIALGAMSNVDKSGTDNEVVLDFFKGDKLILYTDGISEAMNNGRSEYGIDGLETYLNLNSDKNTKQLLEGLVEDVKKFTGSSEQRDDLTLLIIQRN